MFRSFGPVLDRIFISQPFHAGPAEGTKLHARKNICVFYPIELKLCTMIELFIPNNRIVFVFFILTVFGGEMTSQC